MLKVGNDFLLRLNDFLLRLRLFAGLENAILRLVFVNTAFHKRAMLQIFYAEYAESMLDILSYQESTIGPPWLG